MLILLVKDVSFRIALIVDFNLCILSQWFPGDEHPERVNAPALLQGSGNGINLTCMNDEKDCWLTDKDAKAMTANGLQSC